MNILHLTPYFYPAWAYGGTCRAAWEVARATAKRGHEVTAYTTDALDGRRRATPAREVVERVKIRRFANISNRLAWARVFAPPALAFALEGAIRRADVVHLHEYRSLLNAMALPILSRLNKPFILTAQGGVPLLVGRFALKRIYDVWVGRPLLARACKLHALNTMEQKQFIEAGGRPEQIFIAPNCIDVDDYRALPGGAAFRQRHNVPSDAPLVLFLARVNKIKGVDFLVAAFAEACHEMPSAMLAIAGPDDGFLPDVQKHVRELGIEDRVRYVGYTDGAAKLEAYGAADVYALPSTYEILGITLLEALACGAPVITTDRCGLADEIQQNGLGSVVKYGDVRGLSDEIVRALNGRAAARRDSERRREFVLANFTWDRIAERWEAVYAECAASRRE